MPVTPLPSASLILLKDSPKGPQVVMVRRPRSMAFAGGMLVFPGGKVEKGDAGKDPLQCALNAARRETHEEVGIKLPSGAEFLHFAHWITPRHARQRFDTHFFLACVPSSVAMTPCDREVTEIIQDHPQVILETYGEKGDLMVPTRMILAELASFTAIEETLDYARTRKVVTVLPEVVEKDGEIWARLPKEAGYPETVIPRPDLKAALKE